MESRPLSVRLPVELVEAIDAAAERAERSRSWMIVRALREAFLPEGGSPGRPAPAPRGKRLVRESVEPRFKS